MLAATTRETELSRSFGTGLETCDEKDSSSTYFLPTNTFDDSVHNSVGVDVPVSCLWRGTFLLGILLEQSFSLLIPNHSIHFFDVLEFWIGMFRVFLEGSQILGVALLGVALLGWE